MAAEGVGGAIGEAVAAASAEIAARPEPVQEPLFPLPTTLGGADAEQLQREAAERVGRGRPKGAQNLATRELREYLFARGVSPLIQMMAMSMHSPASLARELRCKRIEAARLLFDYQRELAGFLHAKAAPVDDDGKAVPFFQMVVGGNQVTIGAPGAGERPWDYLNRIAGEAQQNQTLGAPQDPGSHGGGSHGGAK
jgi:hypothetical protein